MNNRISSNLGSALRALAVLGPLVVGTACPGEEATPPTGEEDTGDGDTGDGDGDTGDGDGDTGDGDGEPGDGDGEPGDGDGDGDCVGPDGCFACEPTNSIEVINACTDAACESFENTQARLPLLERDGSLPPLP